MEAKEFKIFQLALNAFFLEEFGGRIKFHTCQISKTIDLSDHEIKFIKKAIPKRAYEFSAGRICARKCLSSHGIENFDLLVGEFGEPLWPDGYTGSITHHNNIVVTVTTQRKLIQSIGIDLISTNESLESTDLITCKNELKLFNKHQPDIKPEILIFCIKESVIKICSPLLQEYIDFKDIFLYVDSSGQMMAKFKPVNQNIYIKWFLSDNSIFCLATLSSELVI